MTLAAPPLSELRHASRRLQRRRWLLVGGLGLAAALSVLVDLATGASGLPLPEVLYGLTGTGETTTTLIVWQLRLPVALMAVLVGAALSLAGTEMQTVLGNPLAEPFTLGVSSAAALGAGSAIVLGLTLPGLPAVWAVQANAFVFALGSLALLHLAVRIRDGGTEGVVLLGVAINFAAAALLALVQFVAAPDALQQLVFWTLGSLSGANWTGVGLVALVLVVCLPFSLAAAWRLTALRLGGAQAAAMGVDLARLRRAALVRVSLLAAAAVSMVGVVGFVGLAGPHIARLVVGEDHRVLLPASLFTGGLLMSLASLVSKLAVAGLVLPVGIVTSLIGLPVFVALILRGRG